MSATQPQTQQKENKWAEYERRKAALSDSLTPEQRDAELRKIAEELGI